MLSKIIKQSNQNELQGFSTVLFSFRMEICLWIYLFACKTNLYVIFDISYMCLLYSLVHKLINARAQLSLAVWKPSASINRLSLCSYTFTVRPTSCAATERLTVWRLLCRPAGEVTKRTTNCGWWTSCCFICWQAEWVCWCSMCAAICLPLLHPRWDYLEAGRGD